MNASPVFLASQVYHEIEPGLSSLESKLSLMYWNALNRFKVALYTTCNNKHTTVEILTGFFLLFNKKLSKTVNAFSVGKFTWFPYQKNFTMQKGVDDLGSVSHFSFYLFIFKNVEWRVELSIKIEFVVLPFILSDQGSPWMSFLSIF